MMSAVTESGTTYEFDGPALVRRRNSDGAMRRDKEWLICYECVPYPPEVGEPLTMMLEPLGAGTTTLRTTSPVVSVEGSLP